MYELFFRFKPGAGHGDFYNELSTSFPGTRLSLWCNGANDIVEVEADGLVSYEALQKEFQASTKRFKGNLISKMTCQDKFQLVARTCCCGSESGGTPLSPIFARHNFMEVPPPVLLGGWEYHRLIGFDDGDLKGVFKALDKIGQTEVLHKKTVSAGTTDETFLLSLSSLFGQLTEKQMKALLSAVENGYYEIPKRVTADELAKRQGQPRSTLEEHIRKAESKVLLAMAPYMMLYAKVPESPFVAKTKAAGEAMGARILKQMTMVQKT